MIHPNISLNFFTQRFSGGTFNSQSLILSCCFNVNSLKWYFICWSQHWTPVNISTDNVNWGWQKKKHKQTKYFNRGRGKKFHGFVSSSTHMHWDEDSFVQYPYACALSKHLRWSISILPKWRWFFFLKKERNNERTRSQNKDDDDGSKPKKYYFDICQNFVVWEKNQIA